MPTDQLEISFDGATIVPELDESRLGSQLARVWNACKDSRWRTLTEIAKATGDPEASVSARLRDFRKPRLGSHEVLRHHRGDPANGLIEYKLIANPRTQAQLEDLLRMRQCPF